MAAPTRFLRLPPHNRHIILVASLSLRRHLHTPAPLPSADSSHPSHHLHMFRPLRRHLPSAQRTLLVWDRDNRLAHLDLNVLRQKLAQSTGRLLRLPPFLRGHSTISSKKLPICERRFESERHKIERRRVLRLPAEKMRREKNALLYEETHAAGEEESSRSSAQRKPTLKRRNLWLEPVR